MAAVKEIIFVVEDDPEGGLTARALGESIFTEADTMEDLRRSVLDVPGAIMRMNPRSLGSFGCTAFLTKSLPMHRIPRDCNAERLAKSRDTVTREFVKLVVTFGCIQADTFNNHTKSRSDQVGTPSAILADLATTTGTDKALLIEQL